jgi:chromosome segregation protein
MFRLNRLEVVHWDYWQRFVIPLDASIITIVGPNGSGKTTLLDAMRTLLALDCSGSGTGKRDYKRYVRRNGEDFCWLLGVVDNSRLMGTSKRPFGIPFMQDRITLACHIEKKGGDWVRHYWVADGEVALKDLTQHGQEFGVRDYQRLLHEAGLSPAIAKVLSLEQGQTDKLCEYKPKELLDLVFDVFGDKEVLSRYQEARQHQRATEQELQYTQNNLTALENSLEKQELKVNRYREWQQLRQEQKALVSEIKPRLEFYQLQEEAERAARTLDANKKEREGLQAEFSTKQHEAEYLDRKFEELQSRRVATRLNEQQLREQLTELRVEEVRHETVLAQKKQLEDQSALGSDAVAATDELGQLEQQRNEIQQRLWQKQQQQKQWQNTLEQISQGRRADPMEVTDFRHALTRANIAHDTLADVVEVTDVGWQAAVEAVLAPFAHVILLHSDKQAEVAFALGEQLKYRHLIVPERQLAGLPPKGSLLEVVKLKQPVAPWMLSMLERTQRVEDTAAGVRLPRGEDWVTRQGYLRERRGGRYAATNEPRFGKARLESLRKHLREIEREIDTLQTEMHPLQQRIKTLKHALDGVDAAAQLRARAEEFASAVTLHADAKARRQAVGEKLPEVESLYQKLDGEMQMLVSTRADIKNNLEQLGKDIVEKENREGWAEQEKRLERLAHDKLKLPLDWQQASANRLLQDEWRDLTNVDRRIAEIEKRFETQSWETDEQVIVLRDKMQADYQTQKEDVDSRDRDNRTAQTQTEQAREAYIGRLRYSVSKYSKNLKELAKMAEVDVECAPVALDADDVTLAQAGLEVRFGFDEKGLSGMNDGDASGGQQVMKSLILLVALMMEESRPGGFVFIDEPFAHLDIFNIKRVAKFLQATKAQYLLTTPVTHNVDVYDPSMLTLVTAKKQPNTTWAPRVGVLIRA